MHMSVSRALSVFLALIASVFGALGAIWSVRQVSVYSSWPRVDAVVEGLKVGAIGSNPYGNIAVELRYSNGSSEKSVWAYRSFLPGRGERFARKYSIGTRHTIWVDPETDNRAEVELGWNLETLFPNLLLLTVCLCLLLAAKYFWRFQL